MLRISQFKLIKKIFIIMAKQTTGKYGMLEPTCQTLL